MPQFLKPTRAILCQADLEAFHESPFIRLCTEKVKGLPVSADLHVSKVVEILTSALAEMHEWVNDIPPIQQPMRFGNKAFRDWHARLTERATGVVESLLDQELIDRHAVEELLPYLTDAFGHPIRVDYGTGHESSFIVFLYCLFRMEVLREEDLPAIILRVFRAYLRTMRRLQTDYMLEPAGSHGVWGLDDYHCLVFLFGSAQLIGHPNIQPDVIDRPEMLEEYAEDYLYLRQVLFIRELKKGVPFAESSPMLQDISAIPSWNRINIGLLRLYEGEVLGKLPVIQHFVFGSLFPATWTSSGANEASQVSHTGGENTRAPWMAIRPNPGSEARKPNV